jgi:predicted phage terminase large subunit-like protein
VYDCDLVIEANSLRDFLEHDLSAYEAKHRFHFRVAKVIHSINKKDRVERLQSPMQRGLILFPPLKHSDTRELIDQILAFPTGRHDDAPDALAEAYDQVIGGSASLPESDETLLSKADYVKKPDVPIFLHAN